MTGPSQVATKLPSAVANRSRDQGAAVLANARGQLGCQERSSQESRRDGLGSLFFFPGAVARPRRGTGNQLATGPEDADWRLVRLGCSPPELDSEALSSTGNPVASRCDPKRLWHSSRLRRGRRAVATSLPRTWASRVVSRGARVATRFPGVVTRSQRASGEYLATGPVDAKWQPDCHRLGAYSVATGLPRSREGLVMNVRSKLLDKTSDLHVPQPADHAALAAPSGPNPSGAGDSDAPPAAAADEARFPAVVPGATPRTGPGQMLHFRGQILAAETELTRLREKLKAHEGSLPTQRIDPSLIDQTQWANRHPDSFLSAKFESLKLDIAAAGGNVQAILVRPKSGEAGRFEVVFGHRRHRACLELALPVLATVETEQISDRDLFHAMDRENRERADLSPYEQGVMYRRALDAGLYPSNRRLAEALALSHTWVANVLLVADLPAPILECFRTPLEIQHRHAKDIAAALERDRKAVLRRAEKLRQAPRKSAAGAVVAALIKSGEVESSVRQSIDVDGKSVGTWLRDKAGRLTIQLAPEVVPEHRIELVVKKFAEVLREG